MPDAPHTDPILAAERAGLRLAILCRTAVTAAATLWYAGAVAFTSLEARWEPFAALLGFTLVGLLFARVIGTTVERWWMKYAFVALDVLAVCAAFAVLPVSDDAAVPQIVAFRAYGIYYLFPLVAFTALSLSWRLVAWSGAMVVAGWWSAFVLVVSGMERTLSWGDIPATATRADYETTFLSIDFIGTGNRAEETGLTLAATLILALAVYRARRVFFAQVAAEREREAARAERERVRRALGAYVPEAVADRLVERDGALEPQERHAAVLALDVAGFTHFAAGRPPREVIERLGVALEQAGAVVARHGGVVVTYTGDGFLAAFGLPLPHEAPERAAAAAAREVLTTSDFSLRIGIAAGPVSAGTIGGRAASTTRAYTIYGETVNRAARLETAGKRTGAAINVDAAVAEALDGARALGEVDLPGLGPTPIWTPDDAAKRRKTEGPT